MTARVWKELVWPVRIGEVSPSADIDAALASFADFRRASARGQQSSVMSVIHESAEAAVVGEYIGSADRRWFSEGVARYVSVQVLRKLLGEDRARRYYDVDRLLAKVGPLVPRWLAEIRKTPASKANLETVYAAYQTVTGEVFPRR